MNILIDEPLAADGIELFQSHTDWNTIVSNTTEFSLEPDSGGVKGARIDRVERSTALGIGIVVVILRFCKLRFSVLSSSTMQISR